MPVLKKRLVNKDQADKYKQTNIQDFFKVKISTKMSNISLFDNKNLIRNQKSRKIKVEGATQVKLPFELLDYATFLKQEIKAELDDTSEETSSATSTLFNNSSNKNCINKTFEVIDISSDDDFVPSVSPKRIKTSQVASTPPRSNKRKDRRNPKCKSTLRKQNYSERNSSDASIANNCEAVLAIPSTSKDESAVESSVSAKPQKSFIGVNIPVKVATNREQKLPQLLSDKNKTTSLCTPTIIKSTNTPVKQNSSINILDVSSIKPSSSKQGTRTSNKASPSRIRLKVKSPRQLFDSPKRITESPKTTIGPPKTVPESPKKITISPKKTACSPKKNKLKANRTLIEEEEELWNPLSLTILKQIINCVTSHNHLSQLLTCVEQDKLYQFINIFDDRYKFFCFKLFTRLPKWYNIFKFRTLIKLEMSDPDVKHMYNYLAEKNFIVSDYQNESCVSLLHELLVKDLKDVCNIFKLKTVNQKKGDLIQILLRKCNQQSTLTMQMSFEDVLKREIFKKMGFCVKLEPSMCRLLKKVHLLFSFVRYDLESLNDLYLFLSRVHNKDICMPKYSLDSTTVIFSSIEEFLSFSEAVQCRRDIEICLKERNYKQMLEMCEVAYNILLLNIKPYTKNPCFMRFTADYQYVSTISFGAKHLGRFYPQQVEVHLQYLLKQDQYLQHLHGVWYDLLIMIKYKYQKQYEEAGEILLTALKDNKILNSDIDLQMLSTRGENMKICKSHQLSELLKNEISFGQSVLLDDFSFIEIDATLDHNNTATGKRLYIEKIDQEQKLLTVEEVALNHYKKNGYEFGVHCEGNLFHILFCNLFWDIIYDSSITGAFVLEIQYFPLDLKTGCFYSNRKKQIDQRIKEIRDQWPLDQLKGFINDVWDEHSHQTFVRIDSFVDSIEDLCDIIVCIGRLKLAHFLERIIKNYRRYNSGLPDLFLWTPKEKKCKFVEVKGEKDKLSFKQKVWLDVLRSTGADVEVCHVHTIGSNVTRKSVQYAEAKKESSKEGILQVSTQVL